MRAALLLLVACASPKPAPPKPVVATSLHTCTEAAVGVEASTSAIRPPDRSILKGMQAHCEDDRWPAVAVDCFAGMSETSAPELLARCMGDVPEPARTSVLAELAAAMTEAEPVVTDAQKLADLGAQLGKLSVGVDECDRFVASVARVLGCEAMPIAERLQIGQETTTFWELPTEKLPVSARDRMTHTCADARTRLERHAGQFGCTW